MIPDYSLPKNDIPQSLGASELLNIFALLGISLSLTIAFYYQLALHELPCPLCLLQRVGLIAVGIGFLMNVRFGIRSAHYGVSLIGALLTLAVATRQMFLHIIPGRTNGYGSEVFGVHFYTLAVLSSLAAILFIGAMLMLKTWERPLESKQKVNVAGKFAIVIFTLLIAANLVSTVLECGGGECDSDPTFYQLLGK
ncbi:disulfide bond formation protein B [Glaciimonas sp. Gout2]|nr:MULTISPECIES: disulfide bond formation protein B [unclassified Glaciimonas]MDY7545190.1 disulfide bond formation protein B [Glaciimonas sp. CA11.2]MEB0011311.1 disulfide bond formation protein B [Glaciimonas sp. Cout2]MEB0080961.1 disulfide bond formation protein B [Glaciimonas sp. Gout2]